MAPRGCAISTPCSRRTAAALKGIIVLHACGNRREESQSYPNDYEGNHPKREDMFENREWASSLMAVCVAVVREDSDSSQSRRNHRNSPFSYSNFVIENFIDTAVELVVNDTAITLNSPELLSSFPDT